MSVKITYLGHASFLLTAGGASILVDPYEDGSVPGLGNIREKVSAVFCSHEHGDHNFRGAAEITGRPVPFSVSEYACWHDDKKGALRGKNTVRIFEYEGIRIAHLGDIGHALTPELKEALIGVDALLIPVGGFYTIDAAAAAKIIRETEPGTVIPMHYRTASSGYDVIAPVNDFVSTCPEAVYADTDSLEIEFGKPQGIIILKQKYTL